MKKRLLLKDILNLGGKISTYKNGSTNSISLSKLLKKENIKIEGENVYLCYLTYTSTPQIQAIYKVSDPNNENCELEELYNKLNEIC